MLAFTGLPPPPLAMLEFEPGDDALSPVGDFEAVEVAASNGGGETEAEVVLVEVKEAIEKCAAAAAAAAGKRNGGILGGCGGA